MNYAVFCVQAPDGVAVAPCGTVQGVAMSPLVAPVAGSQPLDTEAAQQLFVWAMSLPIACFLIGATVGAVLHIIKSVD